MNRPPLELAVAFNRAVRHDDEWFDEPDDLGRLDQALASVEPLDDPVEAAAVLAFRVTRAQPFGEGNKRTALLLARWLLDQAGANGVMLLPPDDRQFADLLVKAASGLDVQSKMIALLEARRT